MPNHQFKPSLLGGVMITAGTSVGAGAFALPIISSGMWFGWAVGCMLLAWFFMYHAALYIIEVNLHFYHGASFDVLVKETLGNKVRIVSNISLLFLFYILDYAFISGGGSLVGHALAGILEGEPARSVSVLVFLALLAPVVWIGTRAVDRVSVVLIVGMIITFSLVVGGIGLPFNFQHLLVFGTKESGLPYFYYVFAALPVYLTSFGFYAIVPSLVKYYHKDARMVFKSVLFGSLLGLLIYIVWLWTAMGNLTREQFLPIITGGGNVSLLVQTILQSAKESWLNQSLNIFANFAIASSFLGVSISLFDFIADKFNIEDTPAGRLKTALAVFVPPTVAVIIAPDGFIYGIGFAGLILALNGLVMPAMMVKNSRKIYPDASFKVWGGHLLRRFMIGAGVTIALCQILVILGFLPMYGR